MNRKELQEQLDQINIQVKDIDDFNLKAAFILLLNIVEQFLSKTEKLQEENRQLKDEINRLKGEQGRPTIRAQRRERVDFSSEQERKEDHPDEKKGLQTRQGKKRNLSIDRQETRKMDQTELPSDAI